MQWDIVLEIGEALLTGAGGVAVLIACLLLVACKTELFERYAIRSFYRGYDNEAKREATLKKLSIHAHLLFNDVRKCDDGRLPLSLLMAVRDWCADYATPIEKLVLEHEIKQAEKRKMQNNIMVSSAEGWKAEDSVPLMGAGGSASARIHGSTLGSNFVGSASNHAIRNQMKIEYLRAELDKNTNSDLFAGVKEKIKGL